MRIESHPLDATPGAEVTGIDVADTDDRPF